MVEKSYEGPERREGKDRRKGFRREVDRQRSLLCPECGGLVMVVHAPKKARACPFCRKELP